MHSLLYLYIEILFISGDLYEQKYKNSSNVYFVGYTNSGKSTLINKIIYNYSDISSMITTSSLPNTTIDTIE